MLRRFTCALGAAHLSYGVLAAVCASWTLGAGEAAAAVPLQIPLQGVLRDNAGTPVDQGAFQAAFRLYEAIDSESPIWLETHGTANCAQVGEGCLQVQGGVFALQLGVVEPLSLAVLTQGPLWLGITIEDEPELPRRPLGSAPYALVAAQSTQADVALGLDCTGCLTIEQIAPATRDALAAEAVEAVAQAGFIKETPWQTSAGGLSTETKVGIGVTEPTAELHVAGTIQSDTLCLGGSCISSWDEITADAVYGPKGSPEQAPWTLGITPTEGYTGGGTLVTVSGINFGGGGTNKVFFGGTMATDVQTLGDSTLTARTPAHTAGVVTVVVVNDNQYYRVLEKGFTFSLDSTAPPDLFHVTPSTSDVGGGSMVQLLGSGFSGGGQVSVFFGDVASSLVSLEDDQLLLVQVPPSLLLGSMPVTVSNSKGTSTKDGAFTYTQANGSASSYGLDLYPEACLVDGTTDGSESTVEVSGGPFAPGSPTRLFVDGQELEASQVVVLDEGHLTFACPPHAAGKVDILLTQGSNHFRQDQTFQYLPYGGPKTDGDRVVDSEDPELAHGVHQMTSPLHAGDLAYAVPLVEPITLLVGDVLFFRNLHSQAEGERGQWGRATIRQVNPNMPEPGQLELVFTEAFALASGDDVPINGRMIAVPQYDNLTVAAGAELRGQAVALVIDVASSLTVEGALSMSSAHDANSGPAGGDVGSGGSGSCGGAGASGGGQGLDAAANTTPEDMTLLIAGDRGGGGGGGGGAGCVGNYDWGSADYCGGGGSAGSGASGGGGGGGAGECWCTPNGGQGGAGGLGGGLVIVRATTLQGSGAITANPGAGQAGGPAGHGACGTSGSGGTGGQGGGGVVWIQGGAPPAELLVEAVQGRVLTE